MSFVANQLIFVRFIRSSFNNSYIALFSVLTSSSLYGYPVSSIDISTSYGLAILEIIILLKSMNIWIKIIIITFG